MYGGLRGWGDELHGWVWIDMDWGVVLDEGMGCLGDGFQNQDLQDYGGFAGLRGWYASLREINMDVYG